MDNTPTDADVIQRSLDEPECFAAIFDRHVVAIHGYLARRAGLQSADGLVGEVFRVAFEARQRYLADRPEALPWLYGIAANVLRQHRRAEHRQARVRTKLAVLREPDDDGAVGERLGRREHLEEIIDAVMALPEIDREAMLLYAWEEQTYAEIAEALDVPVGTVRSRLNRARTRVRELIRIRGQEVGDPTADRRCW